PVGQGRLLHPALQGDGQGAGVVLPGKRPKAHGHQIHLSPPNAWRGTACCPAPAPGRPPGPAPVVPQLIPPVRCRPPPSPGGKRQTRPCSPRETAPSTGSRCTSPTPAPR